MPYPCVTLLDEVEQVRADLLGPEALGRGVEVPGEIGDAFDVMSDRPRARLRRIRSSVMRRRSGVMASSFSWKVGQEVR